jgi:predicted GNAT family acetyltransferase
MEVRHDQERSRFFIALPEGDAELLYQRFGDGVVDFQHTEVPNAERHRGVADALVRTALAWARERDLRVIATCPYVQAWLRRHPEERPENGSAGGMSKA